MKNGSSEINERDRDQKGEEKLVRTYVHTLIRKFMSLTFVR